MRALINAFNSGELTPRLVGRVDLPNIGKGALRLRNMLPRVIGGADRRAGSVHATAAKRSDKPSRIIPFNFSSTQRFLIELADGAIRFIKNDQPVLSGGVPYELPSPWTEAEIFDVQFVQINDVCFLTEKGRGPYQLTRLGDANWTLERILDKMGNPSGSSDAANAWPPMLDENIGTTTLTCSDATVGTGRTLTASADLFDADDVGNLFEVAHRRPNTFVELTLTAAGQSAEQRVIGRWTLYTFGDWNGELFLEQKNSQGGWETLRSYSGRNDRIIQDAGSIDGEAILRLRYAGTGGSAPRAELASFDSLVRGLVKVTAVTSATVATVEVVRALYASTATIRWSECAWSKRRGYPRSVALFEQRVVFAGTAYQPQMVFGSAQGDFLNFRRVLLDNQAFQYQIAAQESSPIVGMAPLDGLVLFTEKEEWLMQGMGDKAISPTNVQAKRSSGYGSSGLQPLLIGSVVVFVQEGGRTMLEYVYAYDQQQYIAPDLTQLFEHHLTYGIKQLAYRKKPESVVWAVTVDGKLLSLTYKRDQEVVAWAYHPTAGAVESVAVVNGDNGMDDVYLVVKRTVGGVVRRFIERIDSYTPIARDRNERTKMVYLDCSKRVTVSTPTAEFVGFDHLEGATVRVVADGAAHPDCLVQEGKIRLERTASDVLAGFSAPWELQPMPVEVAIDTGTLQGRRFRAVEVAVRFHLTGACQYADAPDATRYDVKLREVGDPTGQPVPLKSAVYRLPMASVHRDSLEFWLGSDSAEPCEVLFISPLYTFHGD